MSVYLVLSLPRVAVLGQFIKRYFYGIFTFILALNAFENIETSLKNIQNKYHWHLSAVCNNLSFLISVSLQITKILSIKCLAFTVLKTVPKPSVKNSQTNPKLPFEFCSSMLYVALTDNRVLQSCYFVDKVYRRLKVF